MNIRLFKARLHRWIFRSERRTRESRECNKCCVVCKRYFQCLNESRIESFRPLVDEGLMPMTLFEFIKNSQTGLEKPDSRRSVND